MANRTIADVIAEGGLKRFLDPRLIKAFGHPVREHILSVLNERIASPKEIGREIGLEVEAFYHHFEVLEELDCIERVDAKRRRGATEHFFKAKTSFVIDDAEWPVVPRTVRSDLSTNHIRLILQDASRAIRSGAFGASDETHVSWLPARLDRQGLREQGKLLDATLIASMAIRARSARRLSGSGERGTPWTLAILGFETPGRSGLKKGVPIRRRERARVRRRHPASARRGGR
jgi:DNA-binding transcriptional ArsR family regulator